MKGNIRSWWKNASTWLLLAGLAVLGLAGGLVAANQFPYQSLLNVENVNSGMIPEKESAEAQYRAAQNAASLYVAEKEKQILYFQSVEEYFPVDSAKGENRRSTILANRLAKARLSEIYLTQGRLDEALEIFDEFIKLDPILMETEFLISGHAGRAYVLSRKINSDLSQEKLDEQNAQIGEAISKVRELRNENVSLNKFMQGRFDEVVRKFNDRNDALDDNPTNGSSD